jgi:ArsR family transcriptional regulator
MDNFLKKVGAINDETRVKILKFILTNGEVCVCDIETSFEIGQSRVSRHLKILKEADFLNLERRGKWAYFSIKENLTTFQISVLEEIKNLNVSIPHLLKGCKI